MPDTRVFPWYGWKNEEALKKVNGERKRVKSHTRVTQESRKNQPYFFFFLLLWQTEEYHALVSDSQAIYCLFHSFSFFVQDNISTKKETATVLLFHEEIFEKKIWLKSQVMIHEQDSCDSTKLCLTSQLFLLLLSSCNLSSMKEKLQDRADDKWEAMLKNCNIIHKFAWSSSYQ